MLRPMRLHVVLLVVVAFLVCNVAAAELPKTCSQADIEKYGRPVVFERRDGVAYGVSASGNTFPKKAEITVYIWLSNESQSSQQYLMCCEWTFLKRIEVWDAAGTRLDSAADVHLKDLQDKHQEWIEACGCSGWRTIEPGSCGVVDQGTINRKDTAYDLSPGRYTVGERGSISEIAMLRQLGREHLFGMLPSILDPSGVDGTAV